MRKQIAVRVSTPSASSPDADAPAVEERLAEAHVIEVGVAKFRELAKRHWPSPRKEFELDSFDPTNDWHLRMTLAMVFQAMKAAE